MQQTASTRAGQLAARARPGDEGTAVHRPCPVISALPATRYLENSPGTPTARYEFHSSILSARLIRIPTLIQSQPFARTTLKASTSGLDTSVEPFLISQPYQAVVHSWLGLGGAQPH